MSREIDELRRKFFGHANEKETVFMAEVVEVDETEFTCQVRRDNKVDYYDVRLRAIVDAEKQGVALIPRKESLVLVCRIGGSNELFVCQFTEIDKMILTSGELSFTLDQEKVCWQREDTSFLLDAEKVEFTKGDTTLTVDGDSTTLKKGDQVSIDIDDKGMAVKAGDALIRATTGGLTFSRNSSGLKKTLDELLTAIKALTVTTGVGPSGPPINLAQFEKIQQDLKNYMEG